MIKNTISYQQNEWVHLGITFDKSNDQISLFKNGELLGNYSANFDLTNFIDSDVIACESNGGTLIDEFEVYDKSLSNISKVHNSFSILDKVNLNEWSHVVVNHDKARKESEFYINGSNIGKFVDYEGVINNNSQPIVLGQGFTGEVSDVILFERPLFDNEIRSLSSNVYQNLRSRTLFEFTYQDMNSTHITDSSSEGNNGSATSVIRYSPGHKLGSKALTFDGTQLISVNLGNEYDLNQMTISAYIKTSIGVEYSIMKKEGSFEWKITSTGNIQFNTITTNTTQIDNNVFTHIGINIDTFESKVSIYKNGEFTETLTFNNTIPTTTSPVIIGESFNGDLDITRLDVGYITQYYSFDSIISPFDLNKTYDSIQLLGKYSFDESGGVVAIDKSIFKNNGSLINEPTRKLGTFMQQSKGLQFDSQYDQYVEIPGTIYSDIDLNLATVGIWAKLTNTGATNGLIQKLNGFELNVDVNGYLHFQQNGENVSSSLLSIDFDVWTHITIVLDNFNNNITFYKNGSDKETIQPATKLNIPTTTSNIYIGSNLTGELDNVDIYQGILSEDYILTMATTEDALYTPSNIISDEWTHVAAVFDKELNKICIYHNGEYNGCYRNYLNAFSQIGINSNDIYVATTGDGYTFYDGIVDDIRVYNKSMNQSEVKDLVNMYEEQVIYIDGTISATYETVDSIDVINVGSIALREPPNMLVGKTITYYVFATVSNRLRGKTDILAFVNSMSLHTEIYDSTTLTTTGSETTVNWTPENLNNVITTGYNYVPISQVNQAYVIVVGVSYDQQIYYVKERITSFLGTKINVNSAISKPIETIINLNMTIINNTYEVQTLFVAAIDFDISGLSTEEKIGLVQDNEANVYKETINMQKETFVRKEVDLQTALLSTGEQTELQNKVYTVLVLCIDSAGDKQIESYLTQAIEMSVPLVEYTTPIILPSELNSVKSIDVNSGVLYYTSSVGKYYISAFELTPEQSVERSYYVSILNSKFYMSGGVVGENPIINAYVGDKLVFNVSTIGHPFHIKSEIVSSSIPGYTNDIADVINNGSQSGFVEWVPTTLGTYYYQCGSHVSMSGIIIIHGNHNEKNHTINVDSSQTNTYYMTGDVEEGEYPTINIYLDDKLTFNVYVVNHPFNIKSSLVSDGIPGDTNNVIGVSNNGIEVGTIEWTPTSVGIYYYQCGSHTSMNGIINVLPHKYPKKTNMNSTNISTYIQTLMLSPTTLESGINSIDGKENAVFMSENNPNVANIKLDLPSINLKSAFVSFDSMEVREIDYNKDYCVLISTKNPTGYKVYFNQDDVYVS
jgi:plastocyanin